MTIGANTVLKAIDLGWAVHRDGRAGRTKSNSDLKSGQQLAVHYWGCLLWEMRSSCERLRYMCQQAAHGGTSFGLFDFSVSDAVMPEFCRVVPCPRLLASFQSLLAAIKRVDFFQRAAGADLDLLAGGNTAYEKAIGFASDALQKDIVSRFNDLVRLGHAVGEATYEGGWAGDGANVFPDQIDPNSPVDHDLI